MPEPEELGLVDVNALLTYSSVSPRILDVVMFLIGLRGYLQNQKNLRLLCLRSVFQGVARAMDRFPRVAVVQRCALDYFVDLFDTEVGIEAAIRSFPAIFGRIRRARDLFGQDFAAGLLNVLRNAGEDSGSVLRLGVPVSKLV